MGLPEALTARIRWHRYLSRLATQQEHDHDERIARQTVQRQMARYLRAGVITPEDMTNTEVRLRKVWAFDGFVRGNPGLPPDEVERRVTEWKANLQRAGRTPEDLDRMMR